MNCKKHRKRFKQLKAKLAQHAMKGKNGKVTKLTRELHDLYKATIVSLCGNQLTQLTENLNHTGQSLDDNEGSMSGPDKVPHTGSEHGHGPSASKHGPSRAAKLLQDEPKIETKPESKPEPKQEPDAPQH